MSGTREGLGAAGHDDGANLVVVIKVGERLSRSECGGSRTSAYVVKLCDELVAEGVQGLGAIEGDNAHL